MGRSASAASGDNPVGQSGPHRQAVWGLALAALGIVYGDIGTSPLYTLKTVFDPGNGLPLNAFNVIGIVSLIFWSLMIVVSLKYVTLIMRANNHGEGGIMALLALAASSVCDPAATAPRAAGGRRDGRGAVLRRRRDHAGDLGAERGRRAAKSRRRI